MRATAREQVHHCLRCLWLALLLVGGCDDEPAPQVERSTPPPQPQPALVQAPRANDGSELDERIGEMTWVRLEIPGFEGLSLRDRTLLFYFQQALLSGSDIALAQRFESNLAVRSTLEAVLETYRGSRKTPAFENLERYAKRFFFSGGIHHPVSGEKLVPDFTASEFASLVQDSDARTLPLQPGQSVAAWLERITPVLFSEAVAPHVLAGLGDSDPLAGSAAPLYAGVSASEATAFYANEAADRHPRNSRLLERGGQLVEQVYRRGGLYGPALERVAVWLGKAAALAEGPQREALEALTEHLTTGDPAAFERYLRAWRRQGDAVVDLALGFLDRSADPLGRKGVFAGLASFRSPETRPRVKRLREHAAELESRLPLEKGSFTPLKGSLPLTSMQAVLGGGSFATRLPSILRLPCGGPGSGRALRFDNVSRAYLAAYPAPEDAQALALGAREQRRAAEHGAEAQALLTDLREVLGYGLAKPPEGAGDPACALGGASQVLLEARADLVALYTAFDAELIQLGMMPSFETSRALYDAYVRDALLTSLAGQRADTAPVDPRRLAARLVVRWARAQDPPQSPAVQRVLKEGDTYFVIADYLALRRRFGQLLARLQRILAEGDQAAARELLTRHALPVEPALRAQARARLAELDLPRVVGLVQPHLVADFEGEAIRDVRLHYPTSALAQALEDARGHGLLPPFSE